MKHVGRTAIVIGLVALLKFCFVMLAVSFIVPTASNPALKVVAQSEKQASPQLPELPDDSSPSYPAAPDNEPDRPRIMPPGFWQYTVPDLLDQNVRTRDLRKRPIMYWREWANQPVYFGPCLLLALFATIAGNFLLPKRLEAARSYCALSFWRCFLAGLITLGLLVALARGMFDSRIGTPLAFTTLAVLELGLIMGIGVSCSLIGERLFGRLNLTDHPALVARPVLQRILMYVAGSIVFALIMIIPGIGMLPRLGTRLAMLIALLGLGGLVRSKLGTQTRESGLPG